MRVLATPRERCRSGPGMAGGSGTPSRLGWRARRWDPSGPGRPPRADIRDVSCQVVDGSNGELHSMALKWRQSVQERVLPPRKGRAASSAAPAASSL